MDLTSHLHIPLSRERAKRIFAELDEDGSFSIERDEFRKGIILLLREVTEVALDSLGLSWRVLAKMLVALGVWLLLLLAFILLGIEAMSTGNTFGCVDLPAESAGSTCPPHSSLPSVLSAVVNSLLPVAGGIGLSASSDTSALAKKRTEKAGVLTEKVKKALKAFQPKD